MIDALFSQSNYVTAKRMLDATALRQEALASNIANLETPGYKRIDLSADFQQELARAVASGDANALSQVRPELALDPSAVATRRDGNNVQVERELLELSQNSMAHTVETQLISGKLLQLKMAITGRTA